MAEKKRTISSKCGSMYEPHLAQNKLTMNIPLQCSVLSPDKIFIQVMEIRKKKKDLEKNMIERKANAPKSYIQITKMK